ncbi:hypothetical protein AADW59_00470 [Candidatus Hodgkinia cicadicola]
MDSWLLLFECNSLPRRRLLIRFVVVQSFKQNFVIAVFKLLSLWQKKWCAYFIIINFDAHASKLFVKCISFQNSDLGDV